MQRLLPLERGVWAVNHDGTLRELNGVTALSQEIRFDGMEQCQALYVAGALVDGLLEKVRRNKSLRQVELVVRDFTKVFVTPQPFPFFIRGGGRMPVLQRSHLIAVTVNPTSPSGYNLDSELLCARLSEVIHLPVHDLLNEELRIKN